MTLAARDAPHRSFGAAVSRACAEFDFYEIPAADVDLPDDAVHDPEVVEKAFGEVESPAGNPSSSVCEKVPFRPAGGAVRARPVRGRADHPRLAVPGADGGAGHCAHATRGADAGVRGGSRRRLLEAGEVTDEVAARARADEVLGSAWRVRPPKSLLIQEGLRLALAVAAPHLETRRLLLMRFDEPVLLASDAAVAPWSPPDLSDVLPGFATASKLFMPVDRSTCLVFAGPGKDEAVRSGRHQAARVNRAVAGKASRWLVHHPADRPLDGLTVPPRAQLVWRSLRSEPAGRGPEKETGVYVWVRRPRPNDRPANVADGRPLHSHRALGPGGWPV